MQGHQGHRRIRSTLVCRRHQSPLHHGEASEQFHAILPVAHLRSPHSSRLRHSSTQPGQVVRPHRTRNCKAHTSRHLPAQWAQNLHPIGKLFFSEKHTHNSIRHKNTSTPLLTNSFFRDRNSFQSRKKLLSIGRQHHFKVAEIYFNGFEIHFSVHENYFHATEKLPFPT